MARRDLTESQLEELERWSRTQAPERAEQIRALVAELRAAREREATTRFLMAIEGEV